VEKKPIKDPIFENEPDGMEIFADYNASQCPRETGKSFSYCPWPHTDEIASISFPTTLKIKNIVLVAG